jgi:rubrerythrin
MFTKDDFLAYFDQIQNLEIRMYETYRDIHEQISHPKYKKRFAQLMHDESDHADMIKKLRSYFEK